jgi:hypothetical protein
MPPGKFLALAGFQYVLDRRLAASSLFLAESKNCIRNLHSEPSFEASADTRVRMLAVRVDNKVKETILFQTCAI